MNRWEDAASCESQTECCLSSTAHLPAHHNQINIFLLACCVLEMVNGCPNQTCQDTRQAQTGIGISLSTAFLIQEL